MRPLVIPFENSQREPRLYWLSEGSSVLLTDDLLALGTQAITREDRLRAFERMNVPPATTLSHATVIKLGQLVGATHVIIGTFDLQAGQLGVHARVLRLDNGRLLPEVVERGALEDAFGLYSRVARRLVPESTFDPASLERGYPPLTAFEQYIKGLLAAAPATQLAYLEQALKLWPSLHRARMAEWDVYDQQGEHAKALAVVRQVPDGGPLARSAQFKGALSLMNLGRYDEAFDLMTVLNRVKADAALLNNLGVIQLRRVKVTGYSATSLFTEASKLDPEDSDLFFNAGYSSWLAKDPQAAITALREVVRRNAADDEAHYVLGVALQATGATAEAAREKELAKRLSSTYAEWEAKQPAGTPVPKGLERVKTDVDVSGSLRVTSAMAASEQRGQRDQAAFHLDRGRRLFEQERDAEALDELRRAVYLSPYQSEAHLLLGRLYLRAGRVHDAVDALKISIWSEDTLPARLALADAYIQSKEPAAARVELENVLKREPNNLQARRLLATVQ
jgi:tetratricopeptide (TPR) repeat protein